MMIKQIKAARRVSVPIVSIASPDAAATIRAVREAFEGNGAKTPIPLVSWDVMSGLAPLNKPGRDAIATALGDGDAANWPAMTSNPQTALGLMASLPGEVRDVSGGLVARGSIVFMHNAQRFFEDRPGSGDNASVVIQGIWNLRDRFKADRRTLVLLGPSFVFPPELARDVISFEEPMPADEELGRIVTAQAADIGLPEMDEKAVAQAVDAVRGLASYETEQVTAMSLGKEGLDIEALWARKIASVEQTPGLSVDRGVEVFADIGGMGRFKEFATSLILGPKCPLLFLRMDELEKMMGGTGTEGGGDNTGVSQDALGVILREMEDNDWVGILAPGVPGTGKSLVTKAMANEASRVTGRRVLSAALDLGATRGSLVGQSERKIRDAMKRIKAIGGQRVCILATVNRMGPLPPELRSRFRLGIWFFDLPDAAEKKVIWAINFAKYGVAGPQPADVNWTGREIRNCCDIAVRLGCTLQEAAGYIVPVSKSDPESIDRLRRMADGRFLSASYAGPYKAASFLGAAAQAAPGSRALRGEED